MFIMAYNVFMTVRGAKVLNAIVPPPAPGAAMPGLSMPVAA
jgi:hypothetical protein